MEEAIDNNSLYFDLKDTCLDNLIPLNATLELTYRCNQRCVHCYVDFAKSSEGELSLKEIEKVLKQLKRMGTLFITYTGGEIFLRDDIEDVLLMTRELEFGMFLYTNGTMITDDTVDLLLEVKPLSVEVSVYATDENIHDKITGLKGSYRKVVDAIDSIKDAGLPVVAKNTWMKENVNCYSDWVRKYYLDGGMSIVASSIVTPADDGGTGPLNERLDDEGYFNFISQQINMFEGDIIDEYIDKNADDCLLKFRCGIATITMCISPYGDIYPCVQMRISGGNVREMPISLVWEKSHIFKYIRDIFEFVISECSGCSDIERCYVCPGITWIRDRKLLTLDEWFCYNKYMIRKVVSGE